MYSTFEALLKARKLKVSDVTKATGVSASTFSDRKRGAYTPKQDKLQTIADFFGVSLEYLTTGKETKRKSQLILTFEEEAIIKAYRALKDDQKALVCQMLNIKRDLLLSKEA